MKIRRATPKDKAKVLDFCKNTFSWGDYIEKVWEYWILEGNLLVSTIKDIPIGVCHSFSINKNQIWIEGIRVDKNFRRKQVATKLVKESELFAKKNKCSIAKMLIETRNKKSLNLAGKLNYKNKEKWDFYSLLPKANNLSRNVIFANNDKVLTFLNKKSLEYVRSWRWIPMTEQIISKLVQEKKILITTSNDPMDGLAIISESDHFDKTLMVTLNFGNKKGILDIIYFIQNLSSLKNYKRIQILTKISSIPKYEGLEKKLSFFLMEKLL